VDLDPIPTTDSAWDMMLAAEPEPVGYLDDSEIDDALAALGAFSELISPYLRVHGAAVSAIAAEAAARLGLAPDEVALVRRAGLVQDVGRVTVPLSVWDQPGPLGPDDWERVRLHAYHSGRVLACTPWLSEIGAVASLHHERCDGSGYHRGSPAAQLPVTARVLAAADAFCAMVKDRPHRAAVDAAAAARQLRAQAAAGCLDPTVVETVLAVGAGAPARRVSGSDALTAREVEVLRLLGRGAANKQIARTLSISAKTVDNHVQRIYAKAGVSTRAAATVWAIRRGLLG
jgi:HD-GYP domain-containing protein (c-di-GMP phosphodiesterase class II)